MTVSSTDNISAGSAVSLRVLDIVEGTSVDGPGLRTSIYFAGCDHHCPACHNPQSWDPQGGHEMTIDEIMEVVERSGFNVTFSGGDPLWQLPPLIELARVVKSAGYDIWCYTGFTFDVLCRLPRIDELLENVSVIVDGPFIDSMKDLSLLFRGSSNQRLINVPRTLATGSIVCWKPAEF